jgi:hypothetical protein
VTNISVTISPATVSVNVVTTQQFFDSIQGGTNNVTIWQVNGVTGGNDSVGRIDSNGLYHAPPTVPSPNPVTVKAISFEDQNVGASATVTITPAPVVTITSPSAPITIPSGSASPVTFTATETGGSTNTILWYVGPVGGLGVLGGNPTFGTITASGIYTPPRTPPIGRTVTVTAAAQDSPTATATLAVTLSGYSNSSLQGPFAFSMSGTNGSGRFFRAGSFVADGAGHLDSMLEDANPTAGTSPISTTGTYTVGADGRGTLQFNDGLTPSTFRFVMVNGSQLQIIGFDAAGTAAGEAIAQDTATFAGSPLSALSGNYVFDFSGVHGAGSLSQIGVFTADGAGNITQGSLDISDAGTPSQFQIAGNRTVCTPAPTSLSTYVVGTNGRGTATLNTLTSGCLAGPTVTLNFYVVSRGSAKFVGTDAVLQVSGFTSQQAPNAVFDASALNGNYAFELAGAAPGGAIATAGSFQADGSGHLTSGVLDENLNGTPAVAAAFLPGGTYTLSANGRGTMTFATAAKTYTLVFYLGPVGTNTTAVFQEFGAGISSDGNFTVQQSAPFTLASIQGNYALATGGAAGASLQTTIGQIAANGTGLITSGTIDINTAGTLAASQAVSGSYSAPAAPSGRATLSLTVGTLNYAVYVVSPTQIYVVGIQPGQLAVGQLLRQF